SFHLLEAGPTDRPSSNSRKSRVLATRAIIDWLSGTPVAIVRADRVDRDQWRSWCVRVCSTQENWETEQSFAQFDGQSGVAWQSPRCSLLADRAHSPADREPVAAVVIPRTVLAHHWFAVAGAKPQARLLHWRPLAPGYG